MSTHNLLATKKKETSNRINKYIIIPHLQHKIQIDKNLSKFEIELINRKEMHDVDKEHSIIENDNQILKACAIFKHKLFNSRHHPDGNPEMNLIDYIEMLCDWVSYWQADNIDEKLWIKKLEYHCKKQLIRKEITNVLKFTLRDFFLEVKND